MTSRFSRALASAAGQAREALGRSPPQDKHQSRSVWRTLRRRSTRGRKKIEAEDEMRPWAWQAAKASSQEAGHGPQLPLAEEPGEADKEPRPELRHQHTASTTASGGCESPTWEHDFEEDDSEPLSNAVHPSSCSRASSRGGRCQQLLAEAFGSWQFDALALARATSWQPLRTMGMHLFLEAGLVEHFRLDAGRLGCFLAAVERGYSRHAPYHNSAHAAAVAHSMHALLELGGVLRAAAAPAAGYAREEVRLACLLAAVIHDYEHKGVNNDFLIKTSDDRAVRYNDRSVNEHHHVSAACSLLQRPECNFLADVPPDFCRRVRSLVIDLVLSTDVSTNKQFLESFEEVLRRGHGGAATSPDFRPASTHEATMLLQAAMKCADLGHLALEWEGHIAWVRLLEAEFFEQGDREKALGLSVSFLMDRELQGVSETQVGFFDCMALPLFGAMARACPGAELMLEAVRENRRRWQGIDASKKAS